MAFQTYRDILFTLEERTVLANRLSVFNEAPLGPRYEEGNIVSEEYSPLEPPTRRIRFSYYLTGRDWLKDYIDQSYDYPISGSINSIKFSSGYLESYSLNAQPHAPMTVDASIVVADLFEGDWTDVSEAPTNTIPSFENLLNFHDSTCIFENSSNINPDIITNLTWNYGREVRPIYYQYDSGNHGADYVYLGPKQIRADITCDSSDIKLDYSGQYISFIFYPVPFTTETTWEKYGVSGRLSSKTFEIGDTDTSQTVLSLTQYHTNDRPPITSVTPAFTAPTYLLRLGISAAPAYPIRTRNELLPLVEKVYLADRECTAPTITSNASFYVYAPIDAINGTLVMYGQKGVTVWRNPVEVAWPAITVSGFNPITGDVGDLIEVTGLNFLRITDVQFDGVSSPNFTLWSGNLNNGVSGQSKLWASVPEGATVGKIKVISSLRNVSGESSSTFYPQPIIDDVFPVTGTWGIEINLTGKNLASASEVTFNGVASPLIDGPDPLYRNLTPWTPSIGGNLGYTKGRIKLTTNQGMVAYAPKNYQPVVSITGVSAISGTAAEDFAIYTLMEKEYLCVFPDTYDELLLQNLYVGELESITEDTEYKFYSTNLWTGDIYWLPNGENRAVNIVRTTNPEVWTYYVETGATAIEKAFHPYAWYTGSQPTVGGWVNNPFSFPSYGVSPVGTLEDSHFIQTAPTGYKVFFGKNSRSGVYGKFYISGGTNNTLTGLIPEGFNEGYISFLEPDGVGMYPPYTGKITEIGPAPVIKAIRPLPPDVPSQDRGRDVTLVPGYAKRFNLFNFNIYGDNMKDFFGLDWYVLLSGTGNEQFFDAEQMETFRGDAGSILNVTGVITGHTGYYDIYVRNYVGTGYWETGIWIDEATPLTLEGTASFSYEAMFIPGGGANNNLAPYQRWQFHEAFTNTHDGPYPPSLAIDENEDTYFWHPLALQTGRQSWTFTFDNVQDITMIKIKVKPPYIREAGKTIAGAFTYLNEKFTDFNHVTHLNGWGDPIRYYKGRKMQTGCVTLLDAGGEIMYRWLNGASGDISDVVIVNANNGILATGVKQVIISGDGRWLHYLTHPDGYKYINDENANNTWKTICPSLSLNEVIIY